MSIRRLPDWANEVLKFNQTLEYLAAVWFEANTHTMEMKKLSGGYLIKEMLDHFKDKISSTLKPNRSLWIYSAHDATIANVLNSLGLFDVIYFQPFFFSIRTISIANPMRFYFFR